MSMSPHQSRHEFRLPLNATAIREFHDQSVHCQGVWLLSLAVIAVQTVFKKSSNQLEAD